MNTYSRRSMLLTAGIGVSGMLSGCADLIGQSQETDGESKNSWPPAGSLGFANLHDLPHTVGMEVIGPGEPELSGSQRDLTTRMSLEPDETLLVPDVLTEPVRYELAFTFDGEPPEKEDYRTTSISPFSKPEMYLGLVVTRTGKFNWHKPAAGNSSHYG